MRKRLTALVFAGLLPLGLATGLRGEFRTEKNLKLNPGGRFVLDSDLGSVTVTGTKEPGASVVITSNRDDISSLLSFNFDESVGMARVTAHKTHVFGWPRHISLRYEVCVPSQTSLEIKTGGGGIQAYSMQGNADLRTSGGSVEVSDMTGKLTAHTSGGQITLREVSGNARVETSGGGIDVASLSGALDGRTSGGPIRVTRVTGDIYVDTSGGSIRIDSAGGRVVAKTSGGSVEVAFDRGNGRGGEVETSGGSIRVRLDPNVNLNVEASASGGGVTSSLPMKVIGRISSSNLHGTLGSGGESLSLHTSGGSIQIGAR